MIPPCFNQRQQQQQLQHFLNEKIVEDDFEEQRSDLALYEKLRKYDDDHDDLSSEGSVAGGDNDDAMAFSAPPTQAGTTSYTPTSRRLTGVCIPPPPLLYIGWVGVGWQ